MQQNIGKDLMRNGLALAVLTAIALTLFMTSPTNGDFWWFDSSRHAFNGVFIRDFLLDGGIVNPVKFASEYYRKYPAINIGFYPPLFYVTSAPFLAIFGANHAVSQAVVMLYAFGGMTVTYFLCVSHMDKTSAAAAAICVITLPEMALWARQVQPDIPAIALLLATALALSRYLENGHIKWLYATTILLGLAILTRVQAISVAPAVLFFLFYPKYSHSVSLKSRSIALAPLIILSLPSLAMFAYFSRVNQSQVMKMPGMPALLSFDNWTWYAAQLPEQIGWPALAFIICGLIAFIILAYQKRLPASAVVVGVFCLSSWVFFTLISNKEARFNLPSIPFLFLVAAFSVSRLAPPVTRVVLPVLALWLAYQAVFVVKVPVVAGYKEAVEVAQASTPPNSNVLISAHRDGSFIYDMRTTAHRPDIGMRRADKLLVEILIRREFGVDDKRLDKDELLALFKRENIKTIVVQDGYLQDQETMRNFQQLLDSGQYFSVVKKVELHGATKPDEKTLTIYASR
jgi:hypothetical protein